MGERVHRGQQRDEDTEEVYPKDDKESKGKDTVNHTHVGDTCDHAWHNPACSKSSGSWLGSCTYNNGTCSCLHSS
jgi:hypothetical protein